MTYLYPWLKFIHIISSTILFGTSIGTVCVFLYGHNTRKVNIIAAITRYVVFADWIFATPAAVIQLATGLWMVYLAGYSFALFWIWGAIVGYVIAALCWFPQIYLQIKMRDFAIQPDASNAELPERYYNFVKYWFYLVWPTFISLVIVFYLMTNKPL